MNMAVFLLPPDKKLSVVMTGLPNAVVMSQHHKNYIIQMHHNIS